MEMSSWYDSFKQLSIQTEIALALVFAAGLVFAAVWLALPRISRVRHLEWVYALSVWLVIGVLVGYTVRALW